MNTTLEAAEKRLTQKGFLEVEVPSNIYFEEEILRLKKRKKCGNFSALLSRGIHTRYCRFCWR